MHPIRVVVLETQDRLEAPQETSPSPKSLRVLSYQNLLDALSANPSECIQSLITKVGSILLDPKDGAILVQMRYPLIDGTYGSYPTLRITGCEPSVAKVRPLLAKALRIAQEREREQRKQARAHQALQQEKMQELELQKCLTSLSSRATKGARAPKVYGTDAFERALEIVRSREPELFGT